MNKIDKLLFEITSDIDNIDMKMKKISFPVDENNFSDENFLRLYSCSKQYNVLSKVCQNLINKLEISRIKAKHDYIQQFSILESCIPKYDFDNLEICPEAEDLKLKYIKYMKLDKIDLVSNEI